MTRARRRSQLAPSFVSYNSIDGKDSFVLEIVVPGFSRDDFAIEWENGSLEIVFTLPEVGDETVNIIHHGYAPQSFRKSFRVKEHLVVSEKITAEYRDGILRVSLPKSSAALNLHRKIAVD